MFSGIEIGIRTHLTGLKIQFRYDVFTVFLKNGVFNNTQLQRIPIL